MKTSKAQIQGNFLIPAEIKKKLLAQWDKFSDAKRKAILQMTNLTEEAQKDLIERAYKNNPNFELNLKGLIKTQKSTARKSKEATDRKKEEEKFPEILKDLEKA